MLVVALDKAVKQLGWQVLTDECLTNRVQAATHVQMQWMGIMESRERLHLSVDKSSRDIGHDHNRSDDHGCGLEESWDHTPQPQ